MDPIGRTSGTALPPLRPAAAAGGRGAFALPGTGAAAAAGAAAPLGGLLAVQEAAAEPARDRTARRRGHALLAELAALQRDLLADDGVPGARLDRLRALLADTPPAADPALAAAVAAVVLRARIELARFGCG